MLDARQPPSYSYDEEEEAREKEMEQRIDRLVNETRLWRVANSAQWVAWGIVQAKIEGMDEEALEAREKVKEQDSPSRPADFLREAHQKMKNAHLEESSPDSPTPPPPGPGMTDSEDESGFDYLAYAQDRAFFFWGDLLELGLVKEEELPADLVSNAKRMKY